LTLYLLSPMGFSHPNTLAAPTAGAGARGPARKCPPARFAARPRRPVPTRQRETTRWTIRSEPVKPWSRSAAHSTVASRLPASQRVRKSVPCRVPALSFVRRPGHSGKPVLPHRLPAQAHIPADRRDRPARSPQRNDALVPVKAMHPARVRAGGDGRRGLGVIAIRCGRRLGDRGAQGGGLAGEDVAAVAREVEAVGDLRRPRRPLAPPAGVVPAPIAADELRLAMLREPRRVRVRRVVRQHINDPVPLQVGQDGAVPVPSTGAHAGGRSRRRRAPAARRSRARAAPAPGAAASSGWSGCRRAPRSAPPGDRSGSARDPAGGRAAAGCGARSARRGAGPARRRSGAGSGRSDSRSGAPAGGPSLAARRPVDRSIGELARVPAMEVARAIRTSAKCGNNDAVLIIPLPFDRPCQHGPRQGSVPDQHDGRHGMCARALLCRILSGRLGNFWHHSKDFPFGSAEILAKRIDFPPYTP
jgi:hypothetical protein